MDMSVVAIASLGLQPVAVQAASPRACIALCMRGRWEDILWLPSPRGGLSFQHLTTQLQPLTTSSSSSNSSRRSSKSPQSSWVMGISLFEGPAAPHAQQLEAARPRTTRASPSASTAPPFTHPHRQRFMFFNACAVLLFVIGVVLHVRVEVQEVSGL